MRTFSPDVVTSEVDESVRCLVHNEVEVLMCLFVSEFCCSKSLVRVSDTCADNRNAGGKDYNMHSDSLSLNLQYQVRWVF